MDAPVHDADGPLELDLDSADEVVAPQEKGWLAEIVDQLESNPDECRQAFETLETLEPDLRLSILAELSALADRPGAEMLLRLLSSANDSATREAAVLRLSESEARHSSLLRCSRRWRLGPRRRWRRAKLTILNGLAIRPAMWISRIPRFQGLSVHG